MFDQFDEGEPSFTEEEQERWMQSCPLEEIPGSSALQTVPPTQPKRIRRTGHIAVRWIAAASVAAACFFLRHHRLAKGSRTAYKFHPHAPYRPHGSKVENRYGIHRKASTHCVDRQNNHSPGHDCPPRKPPKRTNVGSPLDRTGHVLHQNGLNPPVRHHPTRRGHGSPTADHATLGRHSGRVPKQKEEWTNFPNNMK